MRPALFSIVRLSFALSASAVFAQLPGIDFDDLALHGADPESVVYKSTPEGDLAVDIYPPASTDGLHPALIFVHGGGWTAGTNQNHREHSRYFAARGMVVFNLSYRLIPNSGDGIDLFDQVGDIRSAVRWVRKNAVELGVDPGRVALCGESAGGHLAACVAFIDAFDAPGEDTLVSAKPDLAILLNPITDLPRIPWYRGHAAQVGATPLPVEDTPIDDPLDTAIHPARRLSPLFYAHHTAQPPVLFVHGQADTVVPFAQSESLHHALLAAGHDSELLALPRTDHAFVIPGWGPPEAIHRTLRAMDAFLIKQAFLTGETSLLPLDINRLTNGNFDRDLAGWNASGALHLNESGATAESAGYIEGNATGILDLSQSIPVGNLNLPVDALGTQMLTARLSAWIRVSELSHYSFFELALRFRQADGTVISKHALSWDALDLNTWTQAHLEVLIPPTTDKLEVTIGSAAPLTIEIDEVALTLSSTTRSRTYAEWQAFYFSAEEIAAGSLADQDAVLPDGAPLQNLEKYALRLPRTVSAYEKAKASARHDRLAIQFPHDAKKTDLAYRVHFAPDLDFGEAAIVTSSSEAPFPSDAQGLATVVDPEPATTRFAQVFIEPK